MLDLIRQSAVPSNMMRAASRGALSLPAAEMIEILVHLTHNPVFSEQARMTLAGWDEESSLAAASDPSTSRPVLDYFMAPENWRPRLLPALLENPAVPESQLLEMAQAASREIAEMMLVSPRVNKSANLLHALASNQYLREEELERLQAALHGLGESASVSEEEDRKSQYEIEHAEEIAAEEGKPFQLVGDILDLGFGDAEGPATSEAGTEVSMTTVAPALELHLAQNHDDPKLRERISTLTKIARLSVGERVQLALKGNREERFILIRDGTRVVATAVLESPKLTENEVETFASMKNVQECVLRGIAMKRKFIKMYGVVKALASNPRTPIDIGLPLLNHLLINDLRALSMNKNVSDTIRKLAMKNYKLKTSPQKRD
jgi:hypothetical protein